MQVQAQEHSGFVEPDEPDANVRPAAVYVRLVAASESESVELVLVVLVLKAEVGSAAIATLLLLLNEYEL